MYGYVYFYVLYVLCKIITLYMVKYLTKEILVFTRQGLDPYQSLHLTEVDQPYCCI